MLLKKILIKNNIVFRLVKTKGPTLEDNDGITMCVTYQCPFGIAFDYNSNCKVCNYINMSLGTSHRKYVPKIAIYDS